MREIWLFNATMSPIVTAFYRRSICKINTSKRAYRWLLVLISKQLTQSMPTFNQYWWARAASVKTLTNSCKRKTPQGVDKSSTKWTYLAASMSSSEFQQLAYTRPTPRGTTMQTLTPLATRLLLIDTRSHRPTCPFTHQPLTRQMSMEASGSPYWLRNVSWESLRLSARWLRMSSILVKSMTAILTTWWSGGRTSSVEKSSLLATSLLKSVCSSEGTRRLWSYTASLTSLLQAWIRLLEILRMALITGRQEQLLLFTWTRIDWLQEETD